MNQELAKGDVSLLSYLRDGPLITEDHLSSHTAIDFVLSDFQNYINYGIIIPSSIQYELICPTAENSFDVSHVYIPSSILFDYTTDVWNEVNISQYHLKHVTDAKTTVLIFDIQWNRACRYNVDRARVYLCLDYDVIGDNIDLTITPTNMTSEKQRKSIHWFMNLIIKKRVFAPVTLADDKPQGDISETPVSKFFPSTNDNSSLKDNFMFHVGKVVVSQLKFLNQFKPCLPQFISHEHIEELSKKSQFIICDLLEENEKKNEDMVRILQHVHEKYVPTTQDGDVLNKLVFGGDVATCEEAFAVRRQMQNEETQSDKLEGLSVRPEGLHRLMNLVLV